MSTRILLCCVWACWTLALCPAQATTSRVAEQAGQDIHLPGQAGSGLAVPTVQLQTPALRASLSPALQVSLSAPKVEASALSPVQPQSLPALSPVPGLAPMITPPPAAAASAASAEPEKSPPNPTQEGSSRSEESLSQSGRILFDHAAPGREQAPDVEQPFSLGRWLTGVLGRGDQIPAWPAKTGQKVRLSGRTFVLGARLGEGNSSVVYRAEGDRYGYAVKFIHPEFKSIPHYGAEAEALQDLAHTDIPHARLVARSADGLVLVKALVPGETAAALLARGALSAHARDNLAELAARLLAIGYTADLAAGNLVWNHWDSAWTLVDGGGFRMASPRQTLRQLLDGPFFQAGSADPAEFLAAVRGRLGPESEAWAKTLKDASAEPRLASALAALAAADRARTAAPRLEFGPGAKPGSLDDSWLPAKEVKRRLGFDPERVRERYELHGDDPGKLNTEVRELRLADGARWVSKRSSREIIRNELFLRRVIRRWFTRYFDTPRSLGYPMGGGQALMVMKRSAGDRSYVDTRLSLPQRVALALLVHTFGVSDVNAGNVLYESDGRATLIDFEQALSRQRPVTSRVPDEGIAAEMPWLSRRSLNSAEDYFPAAAQWRRLVARPETQAELRAMLLASGFEPAEAAAVLSRIQANAAQLDWIIQADVEFVNQFARRRP